MNKEHFFKASILADSGFNIAIIEETIFIAVLQKFHNDQSVKLIGKDVTKFFNEPPMAQVNIVSLFESKLDDELDIKVELSSNHKWIYLSKD